MQKEESNKRRRVATVLRTLPNSEMHILGTAHNSFFKLGLSTIYHPTLRMFPKESTLGTHQSEHFNPENC